MVTWSIVTPWVATAIISLWLLLHSYHWGYNRARGFIILILPLRLPFQLVWTAAAVSNIFDTLTVLVLIHLLSTVPWFVMTHFTSRKRSRQFCFVRVVWSHVVPPFVGCELAPVCCLLAKDSRFCFVLPEELLQMGATPLGMPVGFSLSASPAFLPSAWMQERM